LDYDSVKAKASIVENNGDKYIC